MSSGYDATAEVPVLLWYYSVYMQIILVTWVELILSIMKQMK